MEDMQQLAYLIKVQGLAAEEHPDLLDRLKCGVVLALPERIRTDQVIVQPKTNDRSG